MMLIPEPKKVIAMNGYFVITEQTLLLLDHTCGHTDFKAAMTLRDEIEKRLGIKLEISKGLCKNTDNVIYLKKTVLEETYRLTVTEKFTEIAGSGSGRSYGIQTLRQLIRNSAPSIPCLVIDDSPSFENRGFYHDITRGKVPNAGYPEGTCRPSLLL